MRFYSTWIRHKTHFNTDAVRDICKACVIYVYIMQVHKYTHSQYVCSSCCAIMLDPSYFHSFVCADLHCWMCIYVRTFPLTSQKHADFFALHYFLNALIDTCIFIIVSFYIVPSPQQVQADYAESRPDNAASAGKGQDEKIQSQSCKFGGSMASEWMLFAVEERRY